MLRAAIFESTDPDARASHIIVGSKAHIEKNTPRGGTWRAIDGNVSHANVPVLAQLPASKNT